MTQRDPKYTRPTAWLHSAAHPNPPRTRGAIFASLEAPPPEPSIAHRASASLEGSGPTLGGADLPSGERINSVSFEATPR